MQFVILQVLFIVFKLSHHTTASEILITKNLCKEKVKDLSPNEVVQLVLPKEEHLFQGRRNCILSLKLQKDEEAKKLKKNIYEVNLSLFVNGTCWFEILVFSGPPRSNKPLTTLTCDLEPKWKNRVPFDAIYFQYRRLKGPKITAAEEANLSSTLNVSFSMCNNCYTPISKPYVDRPLMGLCNKKTCIDNQYVVYRYKADVGNGCPPCETFEFYVSEHVQLCMSTSMKLIYSGSKNCDARIEIDNKVVLTLHDLLEEYYCLPWQLKGSSVKITFRDPSIFKKSSWNCPDYLFPLNTCAVGIKTNSTKLSSNACSKWMMTAITTTTTSTTTTTAYDDNWSWNDDSDWSSSSESDSQGLPGYFYVISAFFILLACLGGCKAVFEKTKKPRDVPPNSTPGTQHHNDLYQMRPISDNVESPLISDDPLPTINLETNFQNDPPGYAEVTSGDHLIPEDDAQPSSDNVVNAENVHVDNDTRNGDNNNQADDNADVPAVDADPTHLPPPPSYEEACRNFI